MTTTEQPPRPWLCPRDHTCDATPRGVHDTHNAYLRGCRSGKALKLHSDALADYRAGRSDRLIDSTGAARELRALAVAGHTSTVIAAIMGYDPSTVLHTARQVRPTITTRLAARVHFAFLELSEVPAPDHWTSRRARKAALAHGWHPVEAWDHVDINAPDAQPWGRPVTAIHRGGNPSINDDLVAELTAEGLSASTIAARLGCSVRAVERARARLRAAEQDVA